MIAHPSVRVSYSDLAAQIGAKYEIRDLWKQKDIGAFSGEYVKTIPPHDVVMLKMTPIITSNN
jgi:Alpha galactosidase C-terminal beta sandwich domain